MAVILLPVFFPALVSDRLAVLLFNPILVLLMTFGLAYAAAKGATSNTDTDTVILEYRELSGRMIRAGERGILFAQAEPRQIMFIKWDTVREIISAP